MDTLDALFQPVASMVNRQVRQKTPARELCAELENSTIAVQVENTALAAAITVTDGELIMQSEAPADADVVISGSLLALLRMAAPAGEELIRKGDLSIYGDALIAQRFRQLLRYGRPDFEEELSGIVGDAAAHRIGDAVRDFVSWSQSARDTLQQNIGEYLVEESRAVPRRDELDTFRLDVGGLRDDVDRLEARIAELDATRGRAAE